LQRLRASPLGERLILAGSSGIYGISDSIPALTEDIDVLLDADWAAREEASLLREMQRLGFEHQPGTCTFLLSDGTSVDLVGYSRRDSIDRIGGGNTVPIMVFGDLSRLLSAPGTLVEVPSGGRALSPAALTAVKLLTVRLEKGGKDKLQALLLIEENSRDPAFLESLYTLLQLFHGDRIDDAVADAQAAFLAVAGDALRANDPAGGYAAMVTGLETGLNTLRNLLATGDTKP
jgi:hypothetical protein